MSLIDYLVYDKNMSQAVMDGSVFGLSVSGTCYVMDYLVHMNSI